MMNTTVGCSDMAFQGWHLLRKCNLTKEQRQLINLRAPQLEKKKVIEALYLVLGQDHRAASGPLLERRWQGKGHRGRSYNVQDEYVDDEISEAWDESGYYEWDPSPSHHDEAEYYEDPEAFDSSAAYYQYDDETAEEHPWHDVESYDQAYAAYLEVSNVTDRRSSLEIRVVKEQIQSLGGTLRWVSTDRQLADGLTKASMRQNLAHKLRHGRLKFLYDPDYVAAKKKTVAERKLELESSSKSRNVKKKVAASERRILDEEEQWKVQHDPPNEGEAYFVDSTTVLKYVNMVPTAAVASSLAMRRALQCLSIFWLYLAASSVPAAQAL